MTMFMKQRALRQQRQPFLSTLIFKKHKLASTSPARSNVPGTLRTHSGHEPLSIIMARIIVLALLVPACAPIRSGMPSEATTVTPSLSMPGEDDKAVRQVILLVNQERARHDLSVLAENPQL